MNSISLSLLDLFYITAEVQICRHAERFSRSLAATSFRYITTERTVPCGSWPLTESSPVKGAAFTRAQWDQRLAKYGTGTDVPALAFAQNLVAVYPEVKAFLMERNIRKLVYELRRCCDQSYEE